MYVCEAVWCDTAASLDLTLGLHYRKHTTINRYTYTYTPTLTSSSSYHS